MFRHSNTTSDVPPPHSTIAQPPLKTNHVSHFLLHITIMDVSIFHFEITITEDYEIYKCIPLGNWQLIGSFIGPLYSICHSARTNSRLASTRCKRQGYATNSQIFLSNIILKTAFSQQTVKCAAYCIGAMCNLTFTACFHMILITV